MEAYGCKRSADPVSQARNFKFQISDLRRLVPRSQRFFVFPGRHINKYGHPARAAAGIVPQTRSRAYTDVRDMPDMRGMLGMLGMLGMPGGPHSQHFPASRVFSRLFEHIPHPASFHAYRGSRRGGGWVSLHVRRGMPREGFGGVLAVNQ